MAGKNKGKKYIKLKGGEVATPDNEARARDFLTWYGANSDVIRRKLIYEHLYDDEVATDTMLAVYDSIAFKGLRVGDNKFYFLRAYHTNYMAASMKRTQTVSLDAPLHDEEDAPTHGDMLVAPDFDYESYEHAVEQIKGELTEYVRANYDPAACSLFEMYIALQPDTSYKKLARMLGFPEYKVWPVISGIKRDLVERFSARKDFLLSVV